MKWALSLLLFPSVAFADGICADLNDLVAQAVSDRPVTFDLAGAPTPPDCSRSLELGGVRAVTCGWSYPYRDAAAMAAFDDLLGGVARCGDMLGRDDSQVSHPDSYDLRMFSVQDAEVSVSLKDKGALAETWLFLRAASGS